jgi:hypothetical protein
MQSDIFGRCSYRVNNSTANLFTFFKEIALSKNNCRYHWILSACLGTGHLLQDFLSYPKGMLTPSESIL